jgi:hypothetical protein
MVNRQQNEPTVQYLIRVTERTSGLTVARYTIEQVEAGPRAGSGDHPNYNTVQKHLSEMSEKTGLFYEIVAWGDVFPPARWIKYGKIGRG